MNKKLFAITFLILTLILLGSSIYAWFTVGIQDNVDFIEINVSSKHVETHLYIKKNDEPEVPVLTQEDIQTIFSGSLPGDKYRFRLSLNNRSSNERTLNINLTNIISLPDLGFESADLKDAFLIQSAKVSIGNVDVILTPNSTDISTGVDGQILDVNRINNFIVSNEIKLVDNKLLPADATTDVIFTISFDENITSSAYRGVLTITQMSITVGD